MATMTSETYEIFQDEDSAPFRAWLSSLPPAEIVADADWTINPAERYYREARGVADTELVIRYAVGGSHLLAWLASGGEQTGAPLWLKRYLSRIERVEGTLTAGRALELLGRAS